MGQRVSDQRCPAVTGVTRCRVKLGNSAVVPWSRGPFGGGAREGDQPVTTDGCQGIGAEAGEQGHGVVG